MGIRRLSGNIVLGIKMELLKYKVKLCEEEIKKLVAKVEGKFTNNSDTKLMWNKFVGKPRCVPFEMINKLDIPNHTSLYFYLEREDEIYICDLNNIIEFINCFEPWDETDAYIFDDELKWIIAITHEDNLLLTLGI